MKISELPLTEKLNDEDILPVVQNGENKIIKKDDLFKDIPIVDSALDKNSTNAIQNAVVANAIVELEKSYPKWYVLRVDKLTHRECQLKLSCKKGNWNTDPIEYWAEFGWEFLPTKFDGDELVYLTDLPLEAVVTDTGGVNWANSEKFTKIGFINPLTSSGPVDLYEELSEFVDGTTFYRIKKHLNINVQPDGRHLGYCAVGLSSHSEEAVNTLVEELTPILESVKKCCLLYEDYAKVEVKSL